MRKWTPLKRHPGIYEYPTAKGTKYGVRRGYTDSYHKHQQLVKSGFLTWRDADVFLKKFESDLATGILTNSASKKITLETYYKNLLKRKQEMGAWRPATVQQKENYWNTHLKSAFGGQRIDEIKRQPYQHFIDQMVKDGYAMNTIKTCNSIMQIIMNDAEVNNIIMKNPLRHIEIIGAKKPKSQDLSEKQYAEVMKTAKEIFTPYKFGMILLLSLGLRREELVGLRYNSFEFSRWNDEEICAITLTTGRTRYEPDGGGLKNDSSYRTLYVRAEFCKLCHFMIDFSKGIRTRLNQSINDDDFLIVNDRTGIPVFPSYPNKLFEKIKRITGIPVHPHTFRHYFATMALTSGRVETDVMHWLGHKNIEMTQDYTRQNVRGALGVFDGMQSILTDDDSNDPSADKS